MASIAPADAFSSQVSRATLGHGAFHRHRLRNGLSVFDTLDLGASEFASLYLLFNLLNVFAIRFEKSVVSPASLTEGLRPRPTWHSISIPQKKVIIVDIYVIGASLLYFGCALWSQVSRTQ